MHFALMIARRPFFKGRREHCSFLFIMLQALPTRHHSVLSTIVVIVFMAASRGTAQTESVQIVERVHDFNWQQIDCADSAHCMGTFLTLVETHTRRSTDGGTTWSTVFIDTLQPAPYRPMLRQYTIAYPSPGVCYTGCDSGVIRRSVDSGRTWDAVHLDSPVSIAHIVMADSAHGVASQGWTFCVTADGWNTWRRYSITTIVGDSLAAHSIAMPSLRKIVIAATYAGTKNAMLISDDGGETWSVVPGLAGVQWLSFPDTSHGWAVGRTATGGNNQFRDLIWRTEDGGRQWTVQRDTVTARAAGLWAVAAADSMHALAVGPVLTLLRTSDGGRTWETPSNLSQEFIDDGILLHAKTISYPTVGHAVGGTSFGDAWAFIYRADAVTGVDLPAVASPVVVEPNPVSRGEACSVYCPAPSLESSHTAPSITLVDMHGHEHSPDLRVERHGGGCILSFSTEELSAGMYMVRLAKGASIPLIVR